MYWTHTSKWSIAVFFILVSASVGAQQGTAPMVMSPSDFAAKVTTLKQQTKDSLAQEAKRLLSAKPVTPSNTSSSNPMSAPQPISTPTPTSTPSYTGFGGDTKQGSTPTAPSSSDKPGGWNIKY